MKDINVSINQARKFTEEAFRKSGLSAADAEITAENLIQGELRGLGSHGLSRIKPYVFKLLAGGFKKEPEIKIMKDSPSVTVVDGDAGLGPVVGKYAMDLCIKKAKETGNACAAVKGGNHFGITSFFSMMALEKDMIGIAASNGVKQMTIFGGIDPFLGTNPFSIAIPAGERYPIVYDCASSKVARGKIMLAEIEGKAIPSDWAIDKDGNATTNAAKAMQGAVLPFGGYKGSGLAIIISVFTAMLSGALFDTKAKELRSDWTQSQDIGFYFGVLDVSKFQDVNIFKQRIDEMIGEIKQCRKAKGCEEIYLPGELEFKKIEKCTNEGFYIGEGIFKDLLLIKDKLNLVNDPREWIKNS